MDGQVQNGVLYLRYRSSSMINTAKWRKSLIDEKTLSILIIKYASRVPLIPLTVEKIEHENCDFPLSFFLSFSSCITQKLCRLYKRSAHQTIALLSEIFLFLVRAAYKLRSASYGSKHASQSLSYTSFCAYLRAQTKVCSRSKTFSVKMKCK